jgi:four helix bundle protein
MTTTLYVETCRLFKSWPFEMKRVAGQAIASADSVHRNIAEGYCRRSIREYIQHLYIALSSLGESVSGYHAYWKANQLSEDDFENLEASRFAYDTFLEATCRPDSTAVMAGTRKSALAALHFGTRMKRCLRLFHFRIASKSNCLLQTNLSTG